MQWIAAAGLSLVAAALSAQPTPSKAFEVASVKPSGPASLPIGISRTPGRFSTSNTSLKFLITWAYSLDGARLVGAPKNLDSLGYDIVAKIPEHLEHGDLQEMMQSLLAERFKLRVHRETKILTAYTLVPDPAGPKVKFVELGEGFGQNPFHMTDHGRIVGTKVTAAMFAKALSGQLGRPVDDQTAWKEPFDFVLEWTPETETPEGTDAAPVSNNLGRPSIFTALREQMGLRLATRKSEVAVLVIDTVELTPTEN